MSVITTYTRKHIDPSNPDIECIDIKDIAHALSLTCRGNGHVSQFFSVAEHCIFCAYEAIERNYDNRIILACLLHDASEAYMSDVPRPFKKTLTSYMESEERLINMIYKKYLHSELSEEEKAIVKEIDDALLSYDLHYLLDEDVPLVPLHFDLKYEMKSFIEVEQLYLSIFHKYNV